MARHWPNWRPEHVLKASDLAALEDFLLSRVNLTESGLHGVEWFDYRASLKLTVSECGTAKLEIWSVRGVTPSGQPVAVWENEILAQEIHLARPEAPCLDIFIRVSDVSMDAPQNKMWLVANEVSPDALEIPVIPSRFPESLYLGRYSFDADGKPSIVHFPLVRRFCAIWPNDARWKSWTDPLRICIEEWWERFRLPEGANGIEVALASELAKLRLTWSVAPLNEVRQRLHLVKLLSQGADSRDNTLFAAVMQQFPRPSEIGNMLPAALARILAPAATTTLAEVLKDILCPITVRVPLGSFNAWAAHLSNLERFGAEWCEGETELDGLGLVLEGRIRSGRVIDDWSRVVALATIWTVRRYADRNWAEDLLFAFLEHPTDDIPTSVARGLDKLICQVGGNRVSESRKVVLISSEQGTSLTYRSSPAAPLGVYKVVTALPKELKNAIGRCGIRMVGDYLKALDQRKSPGQSLNAAFSHLHVRYSDRREPNVVIRGIRLWPGEQPGYAGRHMVSKERRNGIRIVIAGPERSGRTTLANSIISVLSDESPLQIAGISPRRSSRSQSETSDSAVPSTTLEILVEGVHHQVSVLDTSNSKLIDNFEGTLQTADLIVLTIPPEVIEGERVDLMRELAGAVTRAIGLKRKTLVAVAYTKADEYGILDDRGLRIFWTPRPFEIYYATHRDWNRFIEGLKRRPVVVGSIRGSRWRQEEEAEKASMARLGSDEWADTRTWVVNASRAIWEPLMPPGGVENILNGYFISADPVDEFYVPLHRRGYGQMLADFFAQLGPE